MASAFINVSLPPELATRIRKVACTEGKSLSRFFREAASMYLMHLEVEDASDVIDPAAVSKAYRQIKAIEYSATKLQAAMENVKKQYPKT